MSRHNNTRLLRPLLLQWKQTQQRELNKQTYKLPVKLQSSSTAFSSVKNDTSADQSYCEGAGAEHKASACVHSEGDTDEADELLTVDC